MRSAFTLYFAALVFITGCSSVSESRSVQAINPNTGETETFPNPEDVPDGWIECEGGVCPDPYMCKNIDEPACLVRADCVAVYIELWPPACESEEPPDYCAALPYAGCQPIEPDQPTEPDPCDGIPGCLFECSSGTHNPIDENGCVHTCECVPD